MSQVTDIEAAAAKLVSAFASNDTDAYFDCFSEDATFVFHTLAQPLYGRDQYRALWEQWQAEGFSILGCQSSNAHITLRGDMAIFIHDVATHLRTGGEELQLAERETIVFRRAGQRWLACHEHLSAFGDT
ncbi:YybH family protein [Pseudomonas sp. Marseille-QA0892]